MGTRGAPTDAFDFDIHLHILGQALQAHDEGSECEAVVSAN